MYAHRLARARVVHAPRDRAMSTRGMMSRGTTIRVPASASSRRSSTTVVARARANDGRRDQETHFHTTQGVSARVAAMTRAMGGDGDDAPEWARRSCRARRVDVDDEDVPRDEGGDALVRAVMGIFKSACGTLRWGLPTTGGLACWAAAAANAGDGLLGALSGSLLVGTTLGVCALIFAAASATLSGVMLAWMLAKRWVAGVGNGGASGRDARRGGVRSPGARRRGAERRRDVDEIAGAYEAAVVEGRARADRFGNWQPVVPVVDPRAPGRWGGRKGSPSGDPNAWGTHKTPADFRRERGVDEREDENRGFIGPNEWQSRAAYRQAEGFNDPDLNGGARASTAAVGVADSHAEILKKFEPKERLLPRARPKPQHMHIPTEMLIAMGGASLETHIGANGKDILKTTREKRSSSILSRASRGSTTTVNLFGMGGRDRSSTPPPPTPTDERNRTPRARVERSEESYDDDEGEDARRRARARFQKNLSSSFDFEPRSSYESEFMSNVMESMDAYDDEGDDEDEDLRALRRTR